MGCSRVKTLLSFLVIMAPALCVHGQTLVMKDGRSIAAKALRRQGDLIMATQEISTGANQPVTTGEVGYPLTQIQKLDFPEPAQLRQAGEAILQGKAADAVTQLDQALRYYEGFRDAPGSWWAPLTLLKARALAAQGKVREADPLIAQMARLAQDPETSRAARVQVAAGLSRGGNHARAVELIDKIIGESGMPETLAAAAIAKGQSHLGLKQWEPALLAFLQIPVFYEEERLLQPQALLGSGQAYFGLEDLERAKASLNNVITAYAATAEAVAAKLELEKIARFEKARETPK